ncbi:VCBS repeat-containing protein [Catellatospora sp. KI3]|uniref:FG-GAP repeat domain-containing protein n=1 Tax=Catellatospora sp. KI3 TaxID=3041620 RepID=UPI0024827BC1|nr:VCBS repeat-containing protein [Catellatospora sp. KI3]MDI1464770.1 VCBS repeat-containing protein [Catellatospora sp. KI3]
MRFEMKKNLLSRVAGAGMAVLAAAGFGVVGGTTVTMASEPQAAQAYFGMGPMVSRGDVLARARNWLERDVEYCASTTPSVCAGNGAPYTNGLGGTNLYRPDCSGFVAMAWKFATTSDGWATPDTDALLYNGFTDVIASSSLLPGDALVNPKDDNHDGTAFGAGDDGTGHIVLFTGWADAAHTRINYIHESSEANDIYAVTGELLTTKINNHYKPVRYKRITTGKYDDFDNDGKVDVIGRVAGVNDLYLYRGNRTVLSGQSTAGIGWGGFDMVTSAGDFDGDGNADLFARNSTTKDLYLYPGTGGGQFGAALYLGINLASYEMIVAPGDFDRDGKADLIARATSTKNLYLFKGNGSGGFTGSAEIGVNWGAFDRLIAPGDFNNDGNMDLVARDAATTNLLLYSGNGANGFSNVTQIGIGWGAFDLFVGAGDFDGDGNADLIARNSSDMEMYLYKGNGSTGFTGSSIIGYDFHAFDMLF